MEHGWCLFYHFTTRIKAEIGDFRASIESGESRVRHTLIGWHSSRQRLRSVLGNKCHEDNSDSPRANRKTADGAQFDLI